MNDFVALEREGALSRRIVDLLMGSTMANNVTEAAGGIRPRRRSTGPWFGALGQLRLRKLRLSACQDAKSPGPAPRG